MHKCFIQLTLSITLQLSLLLTMKGKVRDEMRIMSMVWVVMMVMTTVMIVMDIYKAPTSHNKTAMGAAMMLKHGFMVIMLMV